MLNAATLQNGQEQHEKFTVKIGRKLKTKYQYDYRHANGELFSTVKSTLIECREARDKWIALLAV